MINVYFETKGYLPSCSPKSGAISAILKWPVRAFLAVMRRLALAMLLATAGVASAQLVYPGKSIRFIVPFPPGGSTDPVARMIGQKLVEKWGQPVIVDNRPGGNNVIGTEALARSAPDGYTMLLATSTHVINPHLLPSLPYDPVKDFAPVATLIGAPYVLAVHPSVPANNLREFIAYAKTKPGELNYATSSAGGLQHLSGEMFNIMAGVKMQAVPYKGGGPGITDLIAGQVQLAFNNAINFIAHFKSGKLKAMAISGEARSPALPEVPTFGEAGLPGFGAKNWFGVLVPAGTPREVIDKLSTEIAHILAMPDIREKIDRQGVEPFISTPEQFAAMMRTESAKYAKVIKAANIKSGN